MALYLVDTGILIRHLRGQRAMVRLLRGLGGKSRLAASVVSRTEIRARMLPHEVQNTQWLLSRLETVPVDRAIADRAGDLIRRAHNQGRTLQEPMSRLQLRSKMLDILELTLKALNTLLDVAEENVDTV